MKYLKDKMMHIGIFFISILIMFIAFLIIIVLKDRIQLIFTLLIAFCIGAFLFWILYLFFLKPIKELERVLAEIKFVNDHHYFTNKQYKKTITNSLVYVLEKYKDAVKNGHTETLLRQEAEYAELQSQINPHFLYNTLEMIRSEALMEDNYVIADMTELLAKYFRYSIGRDTNRVTLKEEIDNIENYIKIQQYRFENKFEFSVYSREKPEIYYSYIIPKMILQPLVENAIFHGIETKIGQGKITLHIDISDEKIYLTVSDDGTGMTLEMLQQLRQKLEVVPGKIKLEKNSGHNGIALPNINQRLKLLYGEDYGLDISSVL